MNVLIFLLIIICLLTLKYYKIYLAEQKEHTRIKELYKISTEPTDINYYFSYEDSTSYYKTSSNKYKYNKYLKNPTLQSNSITGNTANDAVNKPTNKWLEDEDCIISIPEINLKKIIYTGKKREEHLSNYDLVTATNNMYYKNGGNYIICGHASKLYGHSLNRLNELKEGDNIYIQTKNKKDIYTVDQITYENMKHTSKFCKQTNTKELTIISCAKYISKESYIVIHAKKQ